MRLALRGLVQQRSQQGPLGAQLRHQLPAASEGRVLRLQQAYLLDTRIRLRGGQGAVQ
jgi:hypothetical protein